MSYSLVSKEPIYALGSQRFLLEERDLMKGLKQSVRANMTSMALEYALVIIDRQHKALVELTASAYVKESGGLVNEAQGLPNKEGSLAPSRKVGSKPNAPKPPTPPAEEETAE